MSLFGEVLLILLLLNIKSSNSKHNQSLNIFEHSKDFSLFNFVQRPSPINLVRSSMIDKVSWIPLRFSPEHSKETTFQKIGTPDGVELKFDYNPKSPTLSGGTLKFTYEFEKILLHWNTNGTNATANHGSYHTVNGKYFGMEVQALYNIIPWPLLGNFVLNTLNKKIHSTKVIISQFFELKNITNTVMDRIINNSTISLDKIVPPLLKYATYDGSLVVSPFTQDVKWINSLEPLSISSNQIEELRKTYPISSTVRDIQPQYGRKVFYITPP